MGEAADIVQRQLEAWNRRDVEAFVDGLALDAVMTFGAGVPEPGPFQGREAIREWIEGFMSVWAKHTATLERLVDRGERVAFSMHLEGLGAGSGVSLDQHDSNLLTIADGLIVRWENHTGEPERAFSELRRLADPS